MYAEGGLCQVNPNGRNLHGGLLRSVGLVRAFQYGTSGADPGRGSPYHSLGIGEEVRDGVWQTAFADIADIVLHSEPRSVNTTNGFLGVLALRRQRVSLRATNFGGRDYRTRLRKKVRCFSQHRKTLRPPPPSQASCLF